METYIGMELQQTLENFLLSFPEFWQGTKTSAILRKTKTSAGKLPGQFLPVVLRESSNVVCKGHMFELRHFLQMIPTLGPVSLVNMSHEDPLQLPHVGFTGTLQSFVIVLLMAPKWQETRGEDANHRGLRRVAMGILPYLANSRTRRDVPWVALIQDAVDLFQCQVLATSEEL